MWYHPVKNSTSNFSEVQQGIFDQYSKIEPFVKSIYTEEEEVYRGLLYFESTITVGIDTFYFKYPSEINKTFTQSNINMRNFFYWRTINNYRDHGYRQTIFDVWDSLNNCLPLL